MWTSHHPAPGMGDLLPGFFVVPQNPLAPNFPRYVPHIGEILPGRFSVPQNPLIAQLRQGVSGLGGCCAACDAANGSNAEDAGVAYINGGPVMDGIKDTLASVDWFTVLLAGGVAYFLAKQ